MRATTKILLLIFLATFFFSAQAAPSSVRASDTAIDSYSDANRDSYNYLQAVHPSATTSASAAGQSFTNLAGGYALTSCKFHLAKQGSPVAYLQVAFYQHSGTYGTSSVPFSTPLATGSVLDASTLTTSYVLYEFTFSGSQQYQMTPGTKYCIVIFVKNASTLDANNFVKCGLDNSSPTHSGNNVRYYSSQWVASSTSDGIFYVYGVSLAPTNNALSLDLSGSAYEGTKTLLCAKQDYKFVYQVTHSGGVTDIDYAQIQLDPTGKNVTLRATQDYGYDLVYTHDFKSGHDPGYSGWGNMSFVSEGLRLSDNGQSSGTVYMMYHQHKTSFMIETRVKFTASNGTLGNVQLLTREGTAVNEESGMRFYYSVATNGGAARYKVNGTEYLLAYFDLGFTTQLNTWYVLRFAYHRGVVDCYVDGVLRYTNSIFPASPLLYEQPHLAAFKVTAIFEYISIYNYNPQDTWTFTEESDPSNYVALGSCSSSTSGNQKTFNFLVAINWAWGDSPETLAMRAYVLDIFSSNDQDVYSNVFGVEAHLTSSSLSVNDYRCNPSQTLTFSGYWYYDGTSIYPPDGDYQVKVKLSGVQKGSTYTTLVGGAFSISVAAESTVGSYIYTTEASHMSAAGAFGAVVVDGLKVDGYSVDVAAAKVYVHMKYAYDNSAVNGGTLGLGGHSANTNGTGWAVLEMSAGADFGWGQRAYGVQDVDYGITYKAQNQTLPIAKKGRLIQSDANASSLSWDGVKLTVGFTAPAGSYILKVSGPRPTYVTGTGYDLSTGYTNYLTLSHDGSKAIAVSYAAWGDFYVRSLSSGFFTSIYWTDQKLSLALNGTSGNSGTLTIYCGSRGLPNAITGLSWTEYSTVTKILSGVYEFASPVTITLDWTTSGSASSGGGLVSAVGLIVSTATLKAQQGQSVDGLLVFTWTGVNQITVTGMRFQGPTGWITLAEALPKTVTKQVAETQGKGSVAIRLIVPANAKQGDYSIPVEVDAEAVGGRVTTNGWVNFAVAQQLAGPVSDIMTYVFAAMLLILVVWAYFRRWRRDQDWRVPQRYKVSFFGLGFFDGAENDVLKALVGRYEVLNMFLQLSNPLRLLA